MILSKINKMIPFRRLIWLLVGFSVSLQVIIISYNHLSGYYEVTGLLNLLVRLVYSSILTIAGSILITYPDLSVIYYLNSLLPWQTRPLPRVFAEILLTILIAIAGATVITVIADILIPYTQDLKKVLISNILILAVANTLLILILEAWIFFIEGKRSETRAQNLEKELTGIRFEILKNQLNPHFMFNSLNVLSGLINKDIVKAQKFIDEFALVYRYVLETIEKPVVKVSDELSFTRSYMFLQELRYGKSLKADYRFESTVLSSYIPPLSLQVLAENAIKHNIINNDKPLNIWFYSEDDYVVVKNNLQPKHSHNKGPGLGQLNLTKRYMMISERSPAYFLENNHYIAKIPVILNG